MVSKDSQAILSSPCQAVKTKECLVQVGTCLDRVHDSDASKPSYAQTIRGKELLVDCCSHVFLYYKRYMQSVRFILVLHRNLVGEGLWSDVLSMQ
jgi:hypothetical protein